jgi:hypothetical protein
VVEDASEGNLDAEAFNVASDQEDEIEQRLRQFETRSAPKVEEQNKPTNSLSQKTLEDLLFAGKIEKEFNIAGNKYHLSTLTSKEHNSVVRELYNFGDAADLFIIKSLTLAVALKSINGVKLENITVDGEFDSELYRRKEIIESLQMTVVEQLYTNYSTMTEASTKLVQGEELKNS